MKHKEIKKFMTLVKNEGLELSEVLRSLQGFSSLLDDIITSLDIINNPNSKYKGSIYDLNYTGLEDKKIVHDLALCLDYELIEELKHMIK